MSSPNCAIGCGKKSNGVSKRGANRQTTKCKVFPSSTLNGTGNVLAANEGAVSPTIIERRYEQNRIAFLLNKQA